MYNFNFRTLPRSLEEFGPFSLDQASKWRKRKSYLMEHGHDATLDFLTRRIDRSSWCGEQQKVNAGGYAVYIQRLPKIVPMIR